MECKQGMFIVLKCNLMQSCFRCFDEVIFRFADPMCESSLFSETFPNCCDEESCKVRYKKNFF